MSRPGQIRAAVSRVLDEQTGISPEIAQTIVQLGIELNGIVTLRDLEAGLTYAIRRRQLVIRPLEQE